MSNAQLIRLAVLLSIVLIVLGVALRSTAREAHSLFRNPSLLQWRRRPCCCRCRWEYSCTALRRRLHDRAAPAA